MYGTKTARANYRAILTNSNMFLAGMEFYPGKFDLKIDEWEESFRVVLNIKTSSTLPGREPFYACFCAFYVR